MILSVLLLACADPPPVQAAAVVDGDTTVGAHLAALDVKVARLEGAAATTDPSAALSDLDIRVSRLEALIQAQGGDAARPLTGAVRGLESPSTVTTIDARLQKLEDAVFSSNMGDPGSGLFEVPKTGGKPGAPPPGGKSGPPGPPPGGKGGKGGPPPGGQGGGQGGGGQGGGPPPQ